MIILGQCGQGCDLGVAIVLRKLQIRQTEEADSSDTTSPINYSTHVVEMCGGLEVLVHAAKLQKKDARRRLKSAFVGYRHPLRNECNPGFYQATLNNLLVFCMY